MPVNHRFTRSVLLITALGAGLAAAAAGCGSSSPAPPAPTPSSSSPAAISSGSPASAALLASVIHCLQSHGVTLADSAQLSQIRTAFKALPIPQQQKDFTACGPLLPPTFRQQVAQRIADEQAAASTAPASP